MGVQQVRARDVGVWGVSQGGITQRLLGGRALLSPGRGFGALKPPWIVKGGAAGGP